MSDRTIVKESGHWYAKDGTQVLEVPKAKGDGWKKTTLREARTMNLAPGVTTIIKCAHAPQLDRWKQRQAIMSALTLPRTPDESEDDWLRRIEVDMGETARKAAEEGTKIHAALEAAIQGETYDSAYIPHVVGVQCHGSHCQVVHDLGQVEVVKNRPGTFGASRPIESVYDFLDVVQPFIQPRFLFDAGDCVAKHGFQVASLHELVQSALRIQIVPFQEILVNLLDEDTDTIITIVHLHRHQERGGGFVSYPGVRLIG